MGALNSQLCLQLSFQFHYMGLIFCVQLPPLIEISSKKSHILKSQLCLPHTAESSISYSASDGKFLSEEEVLLSFIENIAIKPLTSVNLWHLKSETVHL